MCIYNFFLNPIVPCVHETKKICFFFLFLYLCCVVSVPSICVEEILIYIFNVEYLKKKNLNEWNTLLLRALRWVRRILHERRIISWRLILVRVTKYKIIAFKTYNLHTRYLKNHLQDVNRFFKQILLCLGFKNDRHYLRLSHINHTQMWECNKKNVYVYFISEGTKICKFSSTPLSIRKKCWICYCCLVWTQ